MCVFALPVVVDSFSELKMFSRLLMFVGVSLVLLVGISCRRHESCEFDSLNDADCIAVVNGKALTAGEVRSRLDVRRKIFEAKKAMMPGRDELARRYIEGCKRTIVYEIINEALFEQYGNKCGVAPTEASFQCETTNFANRTFPGLSLRSIARKTGVDLPRLEESVRRNAYRRDVLMTFCPSATNVTEADISSAESRVARYNDGIDASNNVQRALCESLLRKLDEGASFSELSRSYSQFNPEEGKFWGVFSFSELAEESEEMAKWVFSPVQAGSHGGPFATEEGYAVIKILSKSDGVLRDTTGKSDVSCATLARINIREFIGKETFAHEDIRRQISESRLRQAGKELLAQLHKSMKVKFPNGDIRIASTTTKENEK